jgi:hypothetical protein
MRAFADNFPSSAHNLQYVQKTFNFSAFRPLAPETPEIVPVTPY